MQLKVTSSCNNDSVSSQPRIVVAMVYYGLSLSSSVLVGSPFLNLFLMGLAELLGLALHYLPVERLGRKPVLSASMLMCGTACTLIPAVPEGWSVRYAYRYAYRGSLVQYTIHPQKLTPLLHAHVISKTAMCGSGHSGWRVSTFRRKKCINVIVPLT